MVKVIKPKVRPIRLGIDCGGVILKHNSTNAREVQEWEGTIFSDNNYLKSPEVFAAVESIAAIIELVGEDNVFIISKCGSKVEMKTMQWLEYHNLFQRTGFKREHVFFCRNREHKAEFCTDLELTHYVDDHVMILQTLPQSVFRQIHFHPAKFFGSSFTPSTEERLVTLGSWQDMLTLMKYEVEQSGWKPKVGNPMAAIIRSIQDPKKLKDDFQKDDPENMVSSDTESEEDPKPLERFSKSDHLARQKQRLHFRLIPTASFVEVTFKTSYGFDSKESYVINCSTSHFYNCIDLEKNRFLIPCEHIRIISYPNEHFFPDKLDLAPGLTLLDVSYLPKPVLLDKSVSLPAEDRRNSEDIKRMLNQIMTGLAGRDMIQTREVQQQGYTHTPAMPPSAVQDWRQTILPESGIERNPRMSLLEHQPLDLTGIRMQPQTNRREDFADRDKMTHRHFSDMIQTPNDRYPPRPTKTFNVAPMNNQQQSTNMPSRNPALHMDNQRHRGHPDFPTTNMNPDFAMEWRNPGPDRGEILNFNADPQPGARTFDLKANLGEPQAFARKPKSKDQRGYKNSRRPYSGKAPWQANTAGKQPTYNNFSGNKESLKQPNWNATKF